MLIGCHLVAAPVRRFNGYPESLYPGELHEEVLQWLGTIRTTRTTFSSMSKRRHGYPSEARVKRGDRVVHGNKELIRKAWT
jgi:hypothetical protein